MNVNKKKINQLFLNWLNFSLILVFLIIIVGGLTRLTNSGLSITEWELFSGIIPPLNEKSWINYFNQYKLIPQYKLLNFNMSMEEFKIIFLWEYAHRILGRIIGLFFLIPLIFFYFSNKVDRHYLKTCYIIFFLIVLQGIIGWFMVLSGLVNDVTVSHYRLSVHLTTAILILSIVFWLSKNVALSEKKNFFKFSFSNSPFQILIFLIFSQIILGAFVSGLDAGRIYQTWPLMGNSYVPNDLIFNNFESFLSFADHSLVQFYHRNLAYLLVLYILILSIYIYKKKLYLLYPALKILLLLTFIQVILGVFTLLSGLNIFLASAHQITSVLLVLSALNLYYFNVK
tara:strand:+ start:97 stop:1122 length:1026 start_codon:yes stop_codon:yes gene_type:complete